MKRLGFNDLLSKLIDRYDEKTGKTNVFKVDMSSFYHFEDFSPVGKMKFGVKLYLLCEDINNLKNYYLGEGEGCVCELIDSWPCDELDDALTIFKNMECNLEVILKYNMEGLK